MHTVGLFPLLVGFGLNVIQLPRFMDELVGLIILIRSIIMYRLVIRLY